MVKICKCDKKFFVDVPKLLFFKLDISITSSAIHENNIPPIITVSWLDNNIISI